MTLTEIKEQLAEAEGFANWAHYIRTRDEDDKDLTDEVAKLYAKQALIVAAEQARTRLDNSTGFHELVNKDSIINADLTEIEV